MSNKFPMYVLREIGTDYCIDYVSLNTILNKNYWEIDENSALGKELYLLRTSILTSHCCTNNIIYVIEDRNYRRVDLGIVYFFKSISAENLYSLLLKHESFLQKEEFSTYPYWINAVVENIRYSSTFYIDQITNEDEFNKLKPFSYKKLDIDFAYSKHTAYVSKDY